MPSVARLIPQPTLPLWRQLIAVGHIQRAPEEVPQ